MGGIGNRDERKEEIGKKKEERGKRKEERRKRQDFNLKTMKLLIITSVKTFEPEFDFKKV